MFTVVNGVTSAYAGTYFLKGTTTPSAYSYAYIPNIPVVKNAATKVEAGVVLVSGPAGGARLSRIAATIAYSVPAPTAPSNLVISRIASTTGITLSWTDNSNNESYFMLERSTNGTVYSQIATFASNSTKYTISSLPVGTYYYRVRAYGAGGYSTYSNVASVTIAPVVTIPTAPTNLSVSTASSTTLLYWNDNSNNETGFVVEKSYDNGLTFKPLATTTNPYIAETESKAGFYNYRVRAFNSAGYSLFSNILVVTVLAQIPAPSNMTAGLYNSNSVGMRWDDNSSDELGFLIERSANGTSTWVQFATTTADSFFFSDDNLPLGTYYYRVRAFNTFGYSSYSLPTAPVSVVPPAAPSNITAGLYETNNVGIRWDDNSDDETGFAIEKSIDGITWSQFASTTGNLFSDSNLTLGSYYYRVRAYNAIGSSAYSAPSAPVAVVPPVAPTNVSAVLYESNNIAITWTDNSTDELGYAIEKSTNGTTWTQLATTTYASLGYFADSGLTLGTYYYRVRGFNIVGSSAYSAPSAPVAVVPPAAPSNVSLVIYSNDSIGVSWKDNASDATGFAIDRSTDGITFTARASTTFPMFIDTSLEPGTYYYRVKAYNNLGTSPNSVSSVGATVGSFASPRAPIAPTGIATIASSSINLIYWNDNSFDELGFSIEKSINGVNFSEYATTTDPYFVEQDKTAGKYYYRVRAYNQFGYSVYSDTTILTVQ
jgi:titin